MQKLSFLEKYFTQKIQTILPLILYFQTSVASLMKMNRRVAETGIFV